MNDEGNNSFKSKDAFSLKRSMKTFFGRHPVIVIFGIVSVAFAWLGLTQGIMSLISSQVMPSTYIIWSGLIIIILVGFGLLIYFFGTRSKADFSENERMKASFLIAFYNMGVNISTHDSALAPKNNKFVNFHKLLETTQKKQNLWMMLSFLNKTELKDLLRIIKECLQEERKSLKRYRNIEVSINLDVSKSKLDYKIVSSLLKIIDELQNKERVINSLSWTHELFFTIFENKTTFFFQFNIYRLQGFKDLQIEIILLELQIPLKNGFPLNVAQNVDQGGECRIALDLNPENQNDSKVIISIEKKLDGKSDANFEIPLEFSNLYYETKLNYTIKFSGKAKEGNYEFSNKLYPILEGSLDLTADKDFKNTFDTYNQKILLQKLHNVYPSS